MHEWPISASLDESPNLQGDMAGIPVDVYICRKP